MATLTKNASGTSWNVGNERSYDVWGGVRSGSATGGPKGRYCANLGHVQDDESGLIYLRARYYEPSTGRFISEDLAKDGGNWYSYASNCPISYVDPSGNSVEDLNPFIGGLMAVGFGGLAIAMIICAYASDPTSLSQACGFAATGVLAIAFAFAFGSESAVGYKAFGVGVGILCAVWLGHLAFMIAASAAGMKTFASTAVAVVNVYSMILMAELLSQDIWTTMSDGLQFGEMLISQGEN